jgi:RimJ/RimL family protein N-acetyltransferase
MFAITERLLLRPGWPEDARPLRDAIAHESVAMKLARLPWPYGVGDAEWFLSLPRAEDHADFLIMKRTNGQPQLIGGIGIAHDTTEDGPELGYWITPSEWGKGYVTEAGRAVLALARETLRIPRLVSGHFADNPASGAVLRKLGFRPTGRIENRMCLAKGEARPCVLYAQELTEVGDDATYPITQMQQGMPLAA